MDVHSTDSHLVAALLGGDQAALAEIYDRYGDRLYDTAAAMLADRDEAADAVQEVFLVAALKLDQLRQPERLKAWLFAILRNEVYLRTKRRRRTRPTDFTLPGASEMVAPSDPRADGADVERRELAELVRAAAAGLDERDQLVMELSLRQDLSGDDLAAAVGVTTSQAHVLVHRMRERLSRSLGAFTVARTGRDDCPDLADLLSDWDGTFSVLIRKRVARHVDRCEVCDDTRSRAGALALFGAAPAFAAPADLRDAVLTAAASGTAPRHDHHLHGDGFPHPSRRTRPTLGRRTGLAAAVVVVVIIALAAGFSLTGGPDPTTDLAAVESDTTSTGSNAEAPSISVGVSKGDDPTSTTAGAAEPGAGPGQVVLSRTLIDLAESTTSGSLDLSNPGGESVTWTLTGGGTSPFVWSDSSGTLGAGETVSVHVSINRPPLAEGTVSGAFAISGGVSGPAPVQVRARVERPPRVTITYGPATMTCSSSTPIVVADVTDESAIRSVVLRWSGPGEAGRTTMTAVGATQWEGPLGPNRNGTWTYTVTATDVRGNTASQSRPVVVGGCGSSTTGGLVTP